MQTFVYKSSVFFKLIKFGFRYIFFSKGCQSFFALWCGDTGFWKDILLNVFQIQHYRLKKMITNHVLGQAMLSFVKRKAGHS